MYEMRPHTELLLPLLNDTAHNISSELKDSVPLIESERTGSLSVQVLKSLPPAEENWLEFIMHLKDLIEEWSWAMYQDYVDTVIREYKSSWILDIIISVTFLSFNTFLLFFRALSALCHRHNLLILHFLLTFLMYNSDHILKTCFRTGV